MGLNDHIREARAGAVLAAVRVSKLLLLPLQASLERLLENAQSFEAPISKQNDQWIVVLPARPSSEGGSWLDELIVEGCGAALARYQPRQTRYEGHVAYALREMGRGGLPKIVEFEAAGLMFTTRLVPVELPEYTGRGEGKGARARQSPSSSGRKYRSRGKAGMLIKIPITTEGWVKHHLIPLPKAVRKFFPGYKVDFELQDGDAKVVTHVTAAGRDVPVGALAGSYVSAGMKPVFERHGIRVGSVVQMRIVEPGKVYEVVGVRKEA